MTGGLGGFIAGLEGLSAVERISRRYEMSPRKAVISLLFLVILMLLIFCAWGFFQGSSFAGELDEPESESSSLQAPTEFDEVVAPDGDESEETRALQTIVVYVTGAVGEPGLYTLPANCRVGDAVQAAGGLSPEAAGAVVNLAQPLSDGMQVHIPLMKEVASNAPNVMEPPVSGAGVQGSGEQSVLVNINTADSTTLQTLDGIGPATAQKIIDYRTTHGSFEHKEDLRNVSGIGEKKYAAIEAHITV